MLNNQTSTGFATSGYVTDITATEFEIIVADYLAGLGKALPNFSVKHNVYLSAHDGIYQIDVLANYNALGVSMTVLIECKRYAKPVKRDVVQVLHDKLQSTGAHKGIVFSTSGFQDGAIQYALRHKIALITMLPGRFLNITNSLKPLHTITKQPQVIGEFLNDALPKYIYPHSMFPLVDFLSA